MPSSYCARVPPDKVLNKKIWLTSASFLFRDFPSRVSFGFRPSISDLALTYSCLRGRWCLFHLCHHHAHVVL